MMGKQNKEIYSLNSLRAICCIIVVLFHCPIPGIVGNFISYFLRFPVPIFFMISGYFCKFDEQAYRHRIIETIKYIVFGELFYVVVRVVLAFIQGISPISIILLHMSLIDFLKTLLFGTFYNGSLWFLYALLWSWLLFWGISKVFQKGEIKVPIRLQVIVVSGLLIVLILGRAICQHYIDIKDWVWIFRSSILFGIPFIWIGKSIRQFEQVLREKFKLKVCFMAIAGSYVLAGVEVLLAYHYCIALEIYLSTVPISFFIFLLMFHFQGKQPTLLSRIGKKYSAYIYLCHGASIRIVENIGPSGGVLKPIVVIILSLGFAMICYKIRWTVSSRIKRSHLERNKNR